MKTVLTIRVEDGRVVRSELRALEEHPDSEGRLHGVSAALDAPLPDDLAAGLTALVESTTPALAKQLARTRYTHMAGVENMIGQGVDYSGAGTGEPVFAVGPAAGDGQQQEQ